MTHFYSYQAFIRITHVHVNSAPVSLVISLYGSIKFDSMSSEDGSAGGGGVVSPQS